MLIGLLMYQQYLIGYWIHEVYWILSSASPRQWWEDRHGSPKIGVTTRGWEAAWTARHREQARVEIFAETGFWQQDKFHPQKNVHIQKSSGLLGKNATFRTSLAFQMSVLNIFEKI